MWCPSVLCQAALEALDGLDLFGSRGGPSSVIHIMEDELQQCNVRGRVRGMGCEGVRGVRGGYVMV